LHLLVVGNERAGEAALAEVVLDSALLGGRGLCECDRATEGAGEGRVLELGNADVGGAADGAGASHAGGHLDGDWEVHSLGGGETANADTWDVLGDGCGLEGGGVASAGGGVDSCGEGSGTVLVDLVEGHGDGSVVSGRGHARGGSNTGGGLDTGLCGARGGQGSTVGSTLTEGAAEDVGGVDLTGHLGLGGVASGAHEEGHHLGGVNWSTTVGSAESGGLAGANLVGSDDGGVGLSSTSWGGAITRSSVRNWMMLE